MSESVRSLPLFIANAFTNKVFRGNPAAVCLEEKHILSDDIKQNVAAELKLSETAYISLMNPTDDFHTSSTFKLRWFTPTNEVDLCGHATIASSVVLFDVYKNPSVQLTFHTQSGKLIARKEADRIVLDMPVFHPITNGGDHYNSLIEAVIGNLPCTDHCLTQSGKFIIRLADTVSRKDLESISPDFDRMIKFRSPHGLPLNGVAITLLGTPSNGGSEYDFLSRYFSPWNGIPEDPVTGSSFTYLGPYWQKQLSKKDLFARQCSKRGGEVWISMREDGRIDVAGTAMVFVQGRINLPY